MIKSGKKSILQQRLAAIMALFAMFMLFLGPLFSQVHACERAPLAVALHTGMNDGHMAAMQPLDHVQKDAVSPTFDQCGYCSLWHHFPTVLFDLPVIPKGQGAPANLVRGHYSKAPVGSVLFFQAQPRAPPKFS